MIAQIAGILLQAASPSTMNDMGFLTAGELVSRCNSNAPAEVSYCYAFIAGVHDTLRAYEIWLNLKEFCPTSGLVQGDLRRIFLSYLRAYPAMRNGQAASTVVVALKAAYPCSSLPQSM